MLYKEGIKLELVILGVLMEKPMYGYNIKKVLEERMGHFTDYKFGSIYFALNKLCKNGFINQKSIEVKGNRPQRKLYEITDSGKSRFVDLIYRRLQEQKRPFYAIDEAVFFSNFVDKTDYKKYIMKRITHTENAIKYLESHIKEIAEKANQYHAKIIILHSLEHLRAENKWLLSLKQYIENGDISYAK
ncbi:PadR family transcriptional regulator [Clostridium sp. 'deep sea']|uniref:PadR family transcriptional regulator n=1 Tax=Clostridium sp. 'deep sea' TaxID=2779445 RepID=UPI0024345A2D|nr:PadR family transcriptional regulator [Clostridium sp. 'deep sea']